MANLSARAATGFGGHQAASCFDSDTWVNELLSRNDELIEAIAQNQGLGRTADALTYQQLLQNNLKLLATFCDTDLVPIVEDAPPPRATADASRKTQTETPFDAWPYLCTSTESAVTHLTVTHSC